ncbi:hypothetical protein JR316_0002294 [Psilocybe cubensis]|uniref:Uncharacterized protein n=2 Tax=Psilocybe cubensis TaxID=181762 RepID=A0ACB8HC02_PSICU|nr:hypothetical protein JR316_0002294 [Psilocybe cubensis]KAH9485386.1 hypothetical protein JR316_0002294 [Psilocybe cubensis]
MNLETHWALNPVRNASSSMTSNPKQPEHGYAKFFHLHRENIRAHLNGSQDSEEPLLPSFFPPASFWTASEKDLFFHGLSVFSRLRPDLIAEHIKTKNTLDVCVYLDALHTASLQHSPEIPTRMSLDPAMEVSERWIEHEEIMAQELATSDRCSWSFGAKGVDNNQNRAKCSCPNEPIRKSLPAGFELEANGYLNHLDPTCLTVIESVIREAEPEPENEDLQKFPPLEFATGSTLIDSASKDPASVASRAGEQPSDSDDHDDVPMETQLPMLSDDVEKELYRQTLLRRRLRKRLYMRRKRAEQTGRTIIMEDGKLRPGRPRKRAKLSNVRQKGQSKDGSIEGPDREHDDDEPLPMPEALKEPTQLSSEEADADEDLINEKQGLGGATKPYRVKEFFQESNMDGQAFSRIDLNFFNLSTLGRLLRLFASLNKSPRKLDDVSISTQSIQLMVNITKEFVSELIRHAIITKEQEIRMKRSLRVWKYDRDEINHENVAECLASIGLANISKEQYFTKLLKETKLRSKNRSYPDGDLSGDEQLNIPSDPAQPAGFILPQSLQWCSLPHYQQFYPDDDLLSESIDEEQVKKELADEDILDKEDMLRSKDFEVLLWEKNRIGSHIS